MTSAPAAEPETSKTTSAPAPPVRSRMAAWGSVAVGSMTSSPSAGGEPAAEGADLAQRHLCPLRPGDEADEQPDRTAADHHDGLVGDDLAASHVVAGDCQWLDERGQPQVDRRRQSVKREGGHGPRALERTGGIDAEELEPAADVAEALVGGRLGPGVERANDDGVTDVVAVDARAELCDGAGHLVTDHLRCANPVVHVTVGDVDVGATDAAEGNVEPNLARLRVTAPRSRRP